jgi:hypothetical protein
MNKKEYEMLKILKDKYSINISGCFKRFLEQYFEQLAKNNKE